MRFPVIHVELSDDGCRRAVSGQNYPYLQELAGLSAWEIFSLRDRKIGVLRPVGPDEVPGGAIVTGRDLEFHGGPVGLIEILPVDGGPYNVLLALRAEGVGYELAPLCIHPGEKIRLPLVSITRMLIVVPATGKEIVVTVAVSIPGPRKWLPVVGS